MTPVFPEDAFDWPAFGLEDDVRAALGRAAAQGEPSALATLHGVEGGTPRGLGAQMLLSGGRLTGFLSGGGVEADVAGHARAVLAERRPRRLVYGEGGPADVRLASGARLDILVEPIEAGDPALGTLIAFAEARRPALWLSDGERRACIDPGLPGADLHEALRPAAAAKGFCGASEAPFAVHRRFAPPLRLIVAGDDPIALAVLTFAAAMALEAVLVRPRGPEAPPDVPLAGYLRTGAASALQALRPDPWTAVAVLSHDAELEYETLRAALATDAGYIGALGGRGRIPERNQRLIEAGATPEDLARIRAPIGLPIGGRSPWEIAVSILAEIIAQTADESRAPYF